MEHTAYPPLPQGIHVVAKPTGSLCNLDCHYCFYLEKSSLYPKAGVSVMSDEVLQAFIHSYITSQTTPEVEFVWQGGEPTLAGIDFFRKVTAFQKPYMHTKKITNSLQTNGTLLTDEWCLFLKEHNFLVGISVDGPQDIHDIHRRTKGDGPSFNEVMRGVSLLKKYGVNFNVLVTVSKESAYKPLEIYRFLKEIGAEFIQFNPVIERLPDAETKALGLSFAAPADLIHPELNQRVTDWSVEPLQFGRFLTAIFDEWVRHDVGSIFVMNFEWTLSAAITRTSPVCIFSRQCGKSVVIEKSGDIYACDHYVYPAYRLGNVVERNLAEIVESSNAAGFGSHKESTLPQTCKTCPVLQACWGGCPKHRFLSTKEGEPGLHYLCQGYTHYFMHTAKYMAGFRQLFNLNISPEYIMKAIDMPLYIPASELTGGQAVTLVIR